MLHKIWRYSHFYLTVSSSLFLLLAAITGAILAFKPIQNKLQPFKVEQTENVVLADLVDSLKTKYEEVLDLEVDKNYFVKASVFSMESELDGQFYINPTNGAKLANIPKPNAFFEFITDFHRSLFLKTPGRFFVGITSFLLCLIAITGLLLAIKRQGGFILFFSKIINDKSIQYNHVALGRLLLIPIIIIAFTGTYLSMDRFSLLPKNNTEIVNENTLKNQIPFAEFPIFKNTTLKDVQKLEFPFSTDAEDYFTLTLHDKEVQIHQKTGAIVRTTVFPFIQIMSVLSFNLHTGTGSILWSLVLLISSLAILYFMYSGTVISIQRLRSKIKNKFTANQANIVILIGSENGSTKRLAKTLLLSLLKANQKVFLDDLNNYQNYPNIEQLIVLTATYGQGEPPSNAHLFLDKLQQTQIDHSLDCHVIGFGSFSYPKFCEFAKTIFKQTSAHQQINVPAEAPLLIHNQNYKQFKNWATNWSQSLGIQLDLPTELTAKKTKETTFTVIDKEVVKDNYDETFTLTLALQKRKRFLPGDLLGIIPPNESSERLYSIGKNAKGDLLLSIKKHTHGVCSNYLHQLETGAKFNGTIQQNKEFHLPKTNKTVTLIANGTGIAPFLGMVHQPTKANLSLYWGTRTHTSFELYKTSILKAQQKGTLQQCNIAFSKEVTEYNYVQNLLARDENTIANNLKNGGYFMLCGSLNMRDAVFIQLEKICIKHHLPSFETYKNNGQILTDCY
ncbi:sulfite reductase (NADPH) flavoprotein alpha-component [Wenyingzhuangia heitensis]|uniref:NADPH--hemoprotein reductase n=1 Tax=Wenyingzhuangia heitensis TaxID=1487859 RepID=A0ABX0U496_9FLAO|nr:PepSY domain-containing protein [Wenyingzhuangia heitensis]NIJ43695.1 sulfite reductase (NADPH) flavoprotein alpha-component [Wenyingzhuangia heitensis]